MINFQLVAVVVCALVVSCALVVPCAVVTGLAVVVVAWLFEEQLSLMVTAMTKIAMLVPRTARSKMPVAICLADVSDPMFTARR